MKTILLEGESEGAFGGLGMPLMMGAIFLVMYFFMIRPQKKKEKELSKKRDAVKKSDHVITAGGLHGVVSSTEEETVVLTIESLGKLRIEKSSISVINGEGSIAAKK